MRIRYSLCNGRLCVKDASTEQLLWTGDPGRYPVQKAAQIANSDDCILLLEAGVGSEAVLNLWRYSYHTGAIWKAELPATVGDAYVDFKLRDDQLSASSWLGFRVEIDIATGKILSSRFTK